MSERPLVVLACRVLEDLLGPRLDARAQATYLDFGLHDRPSEMRPVLQERLDAIGEPSTVIVGYGLCGNGVVGIESGRHTLVFPRTHDCVGMMLGSRQRYAEEFAAEPGTYYLTRGWLESGDDPLTDYRSYEEDYGTARAERLTDMMYGSYRKLRLVAFSQKELADVRPLAAPVAEFCRDHWGLDYDEYIGDPGLVERLARANPTGDNTDLLVVPPHTTVTQQMFLDD
jgi:hypothetical protein